MRFSSLLGLIFFFYTVILGFCCLLVFFLYAVSLYVICFFIFTQYDGLPSKLVLIYEIPIDIFSNHSWGFKVFGLVTSDRCFVGFL